MRDYEYLIHLLYCFINDLTPDEKPNEVSFSNVYKIGRLHEVANIAFLSVEKLKNKPYEALYNEWQLHYYFSVERELRQDLDRERVISALHENGVRTLEAQGTVTKNIYPEPYLRMMTDIDLVVDFENFETVKKAIEALGYSVTQYQDYEFFARGEKLTELDFHSDFFVEYMYNRRERYSEAINSPFEHAKSDDGMTFYLTDDYYYLYSLLHTVKHFETAGCGIRRILDLYYLKKAYNNVDFTFVNSVIDKGGFRGHLDLLFAVEEKWFEKKEPELDISGAEIDIVNSGNHGNEDIFTRNNVRKDIESGMKLARLKELLRFIFPKKEYVYLGYPVCRERGYSTFMCWLYRIFATLKKLKFSHAINHIKSIFKSNLKL